MVSMKLLMCKHLTSASTLTCHRIAVPRSEACRYVR